MIITQNSMIRNTLKKFIENSGYDIRKKNSFDPLPEFPSDFTKNDIEIIKKVKPFTLTSKERIYSLLQATKYVIDNDISGDLGSMSTETTENPSLLKIFA